MSVLKHIVDQRKKEVWIGMTQIYFPEGIKLYEKENLNAVSSLEQLRLAQKRGMILEGLAVACTAEHDLVVELPCGRAVIPRTECARGIAEGTTRDIAILSRVGRPVSFVVTDAQSQPIRLSRRLAQEQTVAWVFDTLEPGDIIAARVTHLEPFGVFVDIGCGVPSFIGIEHLSVSRIFHPSERFTVGQSIYAAVLCMDRARSRISLTHRELLGTWEQNAALFHPCETIPGVVRSVEEYGIFVELTPNLSGLAERKPDMKNGDRVSVYIKSILPSRMKIKLNIIDLLRDQPPFQPPLHYYITEGRLQEWVYSPASCVNKHIATVFC